MFARSTDTTDVMAIPTTQQAAGTTSFWLRLVGSVIREHEPMANEMCLRHSDMLPSFVMMTKYPSALWAIPTSPDASSYTHGMERTNDLALATASSFAPSSSFRRYPLVRLADVERIKSSLHFREHRVFKCKGVLTSLVMPIQLPPGSESGRWHQNVQQGAQAATALTHSVRNCTERRVFVTLRSVDAGADGQEVMFEVALMRPTEGMPSRVPRDLYRHMQQKRDKQLGKLSSILDAVVACFTSGRKAHDPVRSTMYYFCYFCCCY